MNDTEWLDSNGYPSEAALDRIKNWPITDGFKELMEFAESLWAYKDCFTIDPHNRHYTIRTCGWSGNEDIISALQQNLLFWSLCWYSSVRGGKHVFQLPEGALGVRQRE